LSRRTQRAVIAEEGVAVTWTRRLRLQDRLPVFGVEAHAEARRRAKEASSDFLARDWSEVALVITRKTGKRSSLLVRMFY
jgi:hypothetical protein